MCMTMYALGVFPLIRKLDAHSVTQICYGDDVCANGSLQDLHQWYDLVSLGPDYGYFINASKCFFLLLKDSFPAGTELFQGIGVKLMFVVMYEGIGVLLLALMILLNLLFQTKFRLGMMNYDKNIHTPGKTYSCNLLIILSFPSINTTGQC